MRKSSQKNYLSIPLPQRSNRFEGQPILGKKSYLIPYQLGGAKGRNKEVIQ